MGGPEIAVASTKAYTSQLIAFYLLGLHLAQTLGTQTSDDIAEVIAALKELPEQVEEILAQAEAIKVVAEEMAKHDNLSSSAEAWIML